jgi:hypothetical protein
MSMRLNRRTVLQGVGCAVGLPLLEAMLPGRAFAAATEKPPVRMAFISFPNGAIMDAWRPQGAGEAFEFGPTMQPLSELKSQVTVLSGLAQENGFAKGDGAGDHARSSASLLTGAHPVKTSDANIRVGQSVDQAAAERVGHLTRLPSLEIGIEKCRNFLLHIVFQDLKALRAESGRGSLLRVFYGSQEIHHILSSGLRQY